MSMKAVIWLPASMLLGMVIGAWGPRADVRDYEKWAFSQVKDAERRMWDPRNAKQSAASETFRAFARVANIPDYASKPSKGAAVPPKRRRSGIAATNAVPVRETAPAMGAQARPSPRDLRARIEEAQALWAARVDVVRAQWKDKLKLDDAAALRLDALVDEMNLQLYDTMQIMAGHLGNSEEMTPELALRLVGDATTIMAETYDKIGALVPADMRGEVSKMRLDDFIDPAVAEPIIAVQDKIEPVIASGPDGGGRR